MQKRENGEELTDDEKLYIEKVRKQLSYDYLRECQEKLNGYIGTVESQNGSTDIVFDPDDYRVCDTFISRINTNEYNANKEDFEK